MRLAVVSHKLVWRPEASSSFYSTDGGFPLQIEAISELFEATTVVVPCGSPGIRPGLTPLRGKEIGVVPLSVLKGRGLRRKLYVPVWLVRNGPKIWKEVKRADAIHAPIPGDVGTIGMIFALLLRKPLFVRHCGNWFVQRTIAERLWKRGMELFGGGRNVMMATGGSTLAPSKRNSDIRWIFSTSLRHEQIARSTPRTLPADGRIRLMIACRQEEKKGTDIVIMSMPEILQAFPGASLDIIGDGSRLPEFRAMAEDLNLTRSITFHGKLVHSEVLSLLREGEVFCYPTTASEGFPKVILEALATGLPVVTTPVSVLPTLVGSGGGILINDPDPSELARAVIRVCSDQLAYQEMSKKAIETAKQYTLEEWRSRIGDSLKAAWGAKALGNNS